ncbi:MAG: DUF1402 family protein [Rhizobiaceae bacterium]
MKSALLSLIMSVLLLFGLSGPSASATLVPSGNRHVEQPPIPGSSKKRTRGTTFEKKYKKIRGLLARDKKLMSKIKLAARRFGIDPIHIIGALVGEHTYNVDAKDRLQTYYVKALAYMGQSLTFKYKNTTISQLIAKPAFTKCNGLRRNYDKWSCHETIWNRFYRGKSTDGQRWPNRRLGAVFFQPLYAGQTFGLGQLNPLTALKVNDMVRRRISREPKLSMNKAPQIYGTIMNPDSTLNYMAAVIRHSIDSYVSIAGMDISKNPGITATLYNLGNVTTRARQLATKNQGSSPPQFPEENYYGWLVNYKLADLRSLL